MEYETTRRVLTARVKEPSERTAEAVDTLVRDVDGIDSVAWEDDVVSIEYLPLIVSRNGVLDALADVGVGVDTGVRKGNFVSRFISRLASANARTWGDGRLDCCDLNRNGGSGNRSANSANNAPPR